MSFWFLNAILISSIYAETINDCGYKQTCECTQNGFCQFRCIDVNSCQESILICEPGRECQLECNTGANTCIGLTLNATNAGFTSVFVSGSSGLTNNANILCPVDQECKIECKNGGTNGMCNGLTIHARDSKLLRFTAEVRCCDQMTIYCPENGLQNIINGDKTCLITAMDNEQWNGINIYANQGWNDVNLICRKNNDNTGCINSPTQPRLHCGIDSCVINDTANGCVNNGPTKCNNYVSTDKPTNIPTLISTNPTKIPTVSPTNTPSQNPTNTNHPTTLPSISPTRVPSVSPSISPSITPSELPTDNLSIQPSKTPFRNDTKQESPQIRIQILILIVIVIIVLICILCIVMVYLAKKRAIDKTNHANLTLAEQDGNKVQMSQPTTTMGKITTKTGESDVPKNNNPSNSIPDSPINDDDVNISEGSDNEDGLYKLSNITTTNGNNDDITTNNGVTTPKHGNV